MIELVLKPEETADDERAHAVVAGHDGVEMVAAGSLDLVGRSDLLDAAMVRQAEAAELYELQPPRAPVELTIERVGPGGTAVIRQGLFYPAFIGPNRFAQHLQGSPETGGELERGQWTQVPWIVGYGAGYVSHEDFRRGENPLTRERWSPGDYWYALLLNVLNVIEGHNAEGSPSTVIRRVGLQLDVGLWPALLDAYTVYRDRSAATGTDGEIRKDDERS